MRRFLCLTATLLTLLATHLILCNRVDAMLEDQFLFFPEAHLYATPETLSLKYTEVYFPAEDNVRLHGWYLPGKPGKPLVLFCHGNAGNISHRIENLKHLNHLGVSTFIFDYRGYGKSQGTATEAGTYSDVRGALQYLRQQGWSPEQMIYFGRSLGAGIALQLALEDPPAALILESPFTSVSAMGRHHYPLLSLVAGWLIQARYDNLLKIGRLVSPLLIFQGKLDTIVPAQMARQLYRQAPQPKQLILLPGAGHNDTYTGGGELYWNTWQKLIDRLAAGE